MKKWIALALALITVLTMAACGNNDSNTDTSPNNPLQPVEGWGEAEGWNGKILGVWYNIQENAGNEAVYGFDTRGYALFADKIDAESAGVRHYTVDEKNKTVSIYEETEDFKSGDLLAVAQIVENGDVIYLIGEDIALAREADLEAARAAYPELAKPAE